MHLSEFLTKKVLRLYASVCPVMLHMQTLLISRLARRKEKKVDLSNADLFKIGQLRYGKVYLF